MTIKLEKDKVTGDTLVYEVTRVTDRDTGKVTEQRVLKGRLLPSAEEQDFEEMGRLFEAGEKPVLLEDLENEMLASTDKISKVLDMITVEGSPYSWIKVFDMMRTVADAVAAKQRTFNRLEAAYKDLVLKAADEVRRNEKLAKETDRLTKSNERLKKRVEDRQREGLKDLLEYKQMLDDIEAYKLIVSKSEELEDAMKEVISTQEEMIKELEGRCSDLRDRLGKYEDVSGLEDIQT